MITEIKNTALQCVCRRSDLLSYPKKSKKIRKINSRYGHFARLSVSGFSNDRPGGTSEAPISPRAPLCESFAILPMRVPRRNMHPDRFRNRFGAFTSAICFRNLIFGEMRMISVPKWSQNSPSCVSSLPRLILLF